MVIAVRWLTHTHRLDNDQDVRSLWTRVRMRTRVHYGTPSYVSSKEVVVWIRGALMCLSGVGRGKLSVSALQGVHGSLAALSVANRLVEDTPGDVWSIDQW
jgi:hypothetical protein